MTTSHNVTPVPAWYSRAGDTPAQIAEDFRNAIDCLEVRGYDGATASGDYEGSKGISLVGALRQAAAVRYGPDSPDAHDLAEDLETRLSAVLYFMGRISQRSNITDLSNQASMWEEMLIGDPPLSGSYRYHTKAEAVELLELAARMAEVAGGRALAL